MPQYFSPGVYVEEVDAGPRPIQGVSTSVTGAVGVTERGPVGSPELVTSFIEFKDKFGGYLAPAVPDGSLSKSKWWRFPNAVEGFFANGGQQLYIVRVTGSSAKKATLGIVGGGGGAESNYGLSPRSVGTWGNDLKVDVVPLDTTKKLLRITAQLERNGRIESQETFDNLKHESNDPSDPLLAINLINRRSQLLTAMKDPTFPPAPIKLDGNLGSNGTIDAAQFEAAILKLEDIEDISLVISPGIAEARIANKLFEHCEQMKYRFAILDSKYEDTLDEVKSYRVPLESKYSALYYPWVRVNQPGEAQPIECPSSGHIAGIYADVDTRRGVHKAPANEVIRGIASIDSVVNKRQQDVINPLGINALRFFPGRGNRVWGARTISSDTNFKYVNVRRIFNFIERSIDEGTQFVVFEPNNPELWSRLRQTITNFLNTQWRAGALEGKTPDEAFFVACDRGTTMTQDDIENGRLICEVGIAPVFPAEFVIFRIQKYTADSKLA